MAELKPARGPNMLERLAEMFIGPDATNRTKEAQALLQIGLASGDPYALNDPRAQGQILEAAVSNKVTPNLIKLYNSGNTDIWTSRLDRAASYPGTMRYVEVPEEVFKAGQKRAAQVGQPTKWDTFLDNEWIKKALEMPKPDVSYVIE